MSQTHNNDSLIQRLQLRFGLKRETRNATQSKAVMPRVRRGVGLLLIICICSASTPATTVSLAGAFAEWQHGFTFWLASSGWSDFLHRGSSRNEGLTSYAARPSQVSTIQIYPGSVTVYQRQVVDLAAIASDENNQPLSGIAFN